MYMIAIPHIIMYSCGEEFFEHLHYEHYHVKTYHTNCTELGKSTVGQYKYAWEYKYNKRTFIDMPMTTAVNCQVPALPRFFPMNKI